MVIPGSGEEPEEAGGQQRELIGWDLLFDFHAMIEELRATDGIVEVSCQMHDPVPNFTIETIEHGLGIRVPRRIKSFYQVTDGLEFSWSYDDDGQKRPGGGAHLLDFATVFDSWLDSLWRTDGEHTSEEQDFFWTLRGLDQHAGPDGREMVVICVEEEYPTYDLFVHDLESRQSHFLELSFREYFDCLLASRGTYGWRMALAEDVDSDDERVEHFSTVAHRFFPSADLARWQR